MDYKSKRGGSKKPKPKPKGPKKTSGKDEKKKSKDCSKEKTTSKKKACEKKNKGKDDDCSKMKSSKQKRDCEKKKKGDENGKSDCKDAKDCKKQQKKKNEKLFYSCKESNADPPCNPKCTSKSKCDASKGTGVKQTLCTYDKKTKIGTCELKFCRPKKSKVCTFFRYY